MFSFDRLEQCLEVALTETAAALPLNHLVEQRRTILHRARENLQHVALVVAIYQDSGLPQLRNRLVDRPDAPQQIARKSRGKLQALDITVILGDPRLPDTVKRNGAFNPEDLETVRDEALAGLLEEAQAG